LNVQSLVTPKNDTRAVNITMDIPAYSGAGLPEVSMPVHSSELVPHSMPFLVLRNLSPWSRSRAKRFFDCACVLPVLPLLLPLMLVIALAVRITSPGPALFRQKRIGLHGRPFTILKFRTMLMATSTAHHPVTTAGNQSFTSVGPFLRRWKLDELPQLLNVLLGDMSIVGPRPKIPEHVFSDLPCRPGITGAATIAFAREEAVLDRIPGHHLESYYYSVVLPAKRKLDAEYMARASFLSDLKIIVDSVLRRWDNSMMESLLQRTFRIDDRASIPMIPEVETSLNYAARKLPAMELPISAKQGAGLL